MKINDTVVNIHRDTAESRYGTMGADVFDFNKLIQSEAFPYYIASNLDLQSFLLKRIGFIQEELSEMSLAASQNKIDEVADAIIDAIYFLMGTAVLLDIPLMAVWSNVHKANMHKVAGKSKRGVEGDAAKPSDFVPPDINTILSYDKGKFYKEVKDA